MDCLSCVFYYEDLSCNECLKKGNYCYDVKEEKGCRDWEGKVE